MAQNFSLFYLKSYDDEIWYVGTLSDLEYDCLNRILNFGLGSFLVRSLPLGLFDTTYLVQTVRTSFCGVRSFSFVHYMGLFHFSCVEEPLHPVFLSYEETTPSYFSVRLFTRHLKNLSDIRCLASSCLLTMALCKFVYVFLLNM